MTPDVQGYRRLGRSWAIRASWYSPTGSAVTLFEELEQAVSLTFQGPESFDHDPAALSMRTSCMVWQSGMVFATIENMIKEARRRRLRPVVVPASLDELHGPSSGIVTPPRRLWWSGTEDTAFDLDNRAQAAELYEAIFEAARTYQDITDHLNAELLIALWPDLGMRHATRQAWEAVHPVLAAAAASSHVA